MFNRREILSGGGLAAAGGLVTLAVSRPVEAAATDQLPAVQSAGPFMIDGGQPESILIGLLLPAVQKVRAPFRFALLAGDGSVLVARELTTDQRSTSPFMASYFTILADGDGLVEVVDRNSKESLYKGSPSGGQIIAILIGLLDGTGKTHGAIGGTVQFMGGGDFAGPRAILPYIEQQS